ncbi:hypothetical protein KFU94_41865 [Chloroflexi bacterium TSY]|nr:hypothetical protein [Chloroflexi bacterium TSY]
MKPNYVREMRDLGLGELTYDEICELGSHGIKPNYVREMRALGFNNLTVGDICELGSHGVTPTYVRDAYAWSREAFCRHCGPNV